MMNPIRSIAKVTMNQTGVLIQKQKDLNKYLYDNLYFILIPLFILIFLYIFYISISDFSNISQRFFITLVIIKSINILLSAFLIISFSSFLYYEINPDYKMIDLKISDNKKEFRLPNTFMSFNKTSKNIKNKEPKDFKDFFEDEKKYNIFIEILEKQKIKKSLTATNAIILLYKLIKLDVLKRHSQIDLCKYATIFFNLTIDPGAYSRIFNSFVNKSEFDIHKDVYNNYYVFNDIIK